jgi:sortase A
MKVYKFLGPCFLVFGLLILLFTFFPVLKQEVNYQLHKKDYQRSVVVDSSTTTQATASGQPSLAFKPVVIVPKSLDFSLVIPSLGVNSLVFPGIDSGNPKIYLPVLKNGVAQAKGSSLPDQPGPVFIFGHSTDSFYNIVRYNAAFYLLNKLNPGDTAYIYYHQRKYIYKVEEKKIVNPDEVSSFVAGIKKNTLVLQTCWPPGTTLKRLLIISTPIK